MKRKSIFGFNIRGEEDVLYHSNRSWRSYLLWIVFSLLWIFFGLFYPLLFFIGVISIVMILVSFTSSKFLITTNGVYAKYWNVLESKIDYLPWEDVEKIVVERSNMGDVLDYGDIHIGPLGKESITLKGIKNPDRLVSFVEDVR
ncbi:MAG: hypothetical protein R6U17_05210 [Thermoplasmata archaeon]